MSLSSQVAMLSLAASLFAFSSAHGGGVASSAYRATTNGTEPDDGSGLSSDEISYIIMGACGLVIVVVGLICFIRMHKNTERFARQSALFDRFRAQDLERQDPPAAPYELQTWPLATQADERKY